MDYSYNYRFLSEFREENKLSKRDLLEALGSSDYTGINRWLDGKTPIHLTAMLRLCNYYNIPMSRFFFDADGESTLHILPPDADSQTTPTDDYGINNTAGKSIIETHITTRLISSGALLLRGCCWVFCSSMRYESPIWKGISVEIAFARSVPCVSVWLANSGCSAITRLARTARILARFSSGNV